MWKGLELLTVYRRIDLLASPTAQDMLHWMTPQNGHQCRRDGPALLTEYVTAEQPCCVVSSLSPEVCKQRQAIHLSRMLSGEFIHTEGFFFQP